jgi:hypothetical protein
MKRNAKLIPEEDFYVLNLIIYNVEDNHPLSGVQLDISMPRPIASGRFRGGIEARAEVIVAAAPVKYRKRRHLSRETRLLHFRE